jgi:phosphonate transport system substrate-binding protein
MKKFLFLFLVVLAAFTFAACSEEEDKVIEIDFVPSQKVTDIMLKTTAIEKLLEDRIEGYTFNVTVGLSYEAVMEGMLSGQIDVGFLTAQQYAYMTVDHPGKVNVILTSVRNGLAAQYKADGTMASDAEVMAAMNAVGYEAQLAEEEVTAYNSILLVRTADYTAGFDSLADLAGKTVATQSSTSGSGYVYPAVLLDQNNMQFVTGTPVAANGDVKAVQVNGHQAGVLAVLNQDADACFVYMDARNSDAVLDVYPNAFSDLKVIALSPAIYNDTISVVSSMSQTLQDQIQAAFMDLATTEAGLAAISVYSHTGYKIAIDGDYDGERTVYIFKRDNLS